MIGSPCTDNATHSESGTVGAAWVRYRAFPQEPRPEQHSRVRRVIPLTIHGVSAPRARLTANCGWYRGRIAFRPDFVGMMGFYFLEITLLGGEKR